MQARSALLVLLVACAGVARAGDPLEEKRDALLGADFLKKNQWVTDFDKAKQAAKDTGKPILVYFTTSKEDSPGCRYTESHFLVDPGFAGLAKKFVLYCNVTSGVKGDKDQALLREKGGTGWPTFVFLDEKGELIIKCRGMKVPRFYDETGERAVRYIDARAKVAKGGSASDKADLLIAALDVGKIKADDAKKRLAVLGAKLSEAQQAALEAAETVALVNEIGDALKPTDEQAILDAGRAFLDHKKSGKALPKTDAELMQYCIGILRFAEHEKDAATYEELLGVLKKHLDGVADAAAFLGKCDKTLADLKEKQEKK